MYNILEKEAELTEYLRVTLENFWKDKNIARSYTESLKRDYTLNASTSPSGSGSLYVISDDDSEDDDDGNGDEDGVFIISYKLTDQM